MIENENKVQVAWVLNLLGHEGLKLYNTIKKNVNEIVASILKLLEEYCIPKLMKI